MQGPCYDRDDFRSFATLLRKLLAQKEPTNIYRVINILAKHDPREDGLVYRQIKKELRDMENSFGIARIIVGRGSEQGELSPKRILDTVFNADIFHSDPGKQDDLRRIREFAPITYPLIVAHSVMIVNQALHFAAIIRNRAYLV